MLRLVELRGLNVDLVLWLDFLDDGDWRLLGMLRRVDFEVVSVFVFDLLGDVGLAIELDGIVEVIIILELLNHLLRSLQELCSFEGLRVLWLLWLLIWVLAGVEGLVEDEEIGLLLFNLPICSLEDWLINFDLEVFHNFWNDDLLLEVNHDPHLLSELDAVSVRKSEEALVEACLGWGIELNKDLDLLTRFDALANAPWESSHVLIAVCLHEHGIEWPGCLAGVLELPAQNEVRIGEVGDTIGLWLLDALRLEGPYHLGSLLYWDRNLDQRFLRSWLAWLL